jgi:hypothetical protein
MSLPLLPELMLFYVLEKNSRPEKWLFAISNHGLVDGTNPLVSFVLAPATITPEV